MLCWQGDGWLSWLSCQEMIGKVDVSWTTMFGAAKLIRSWVAVVWWQGYWWLVQQIGMAVRLDGSVGSEMDGYKLVQRVRIGFCIQHPLKSCKATSNNFFLCLTNIQKYQYQCKFSSTRQLTIPYLAIVMFIGIIFNRFIAGAAKDRK